MLSLCVLTNYQIADDIVQNTYTLLNFAWASCRCIELNEVVELYKLNNLEQFETLGDLNSVPKDLTVFLLKEIMEKQRGPSYKFMGDNVTSIQIIPKEEEIKNMREFLGL